MPCNYFPFISKFMKWRILATAQLCSLYSFGISASTGDGDLSSNKQLHSGLVWGFRELQNPQLQGHWQSKRHCKGIRGWATADKSTPFNLHNLWQWGRLHGPKGSLGSGFRLGLVLSESKSLQLQEHKGWKWQAKAIPAWPQHCCSCFFLKSSTHGDGHFRVSLRVRAMFRVMIRVEWVKEPTAPGTMWL